MSGRLAIQVSPESRERLLAWAWTRFEGSLVGVDEGTVLVDPDPKSSGLPWTATLDEGLAPADRDWIRESGNPELTLYFSTLQDARDAAEILKRESAVTAVGAAEAVPDRDWNAEWKAAFKTIEVPPCWRVIPPWEKAERPGDLIINPGAGFGTGTHDTTRLCLQLVGEIRDRLQGARVLDFGSGSGILSIAAAKSGAIVDAVEIDELAIENARENARLNGCEGRIHFHTRIPESPETYDWVIANILKNVLLKFAGPLCARTGKGMVLSGLLEEDLAPVLMRFSQELKPARPPRILRSETEYGLATDGERWRALVFFTAR